MRTTLPRLAAALAAAGLLAGHAPGAGAQIVRLPERDQALEGSAAAAFSIGAEEGESWEMLSNVRGVAFDRSDNLYVLDGGSQRVLVFDRTGKFVRQIGKKGEGPGELMLPLGMDVGPDGTVYVQDLAKRSYSLFRSDGTFVRSIPFSEEWTPAPGARLRYHPAGGLLATMGPSPTRMLEQEGSFQRTGRSVPLMFQPLAQGGQLRTVFEVPQVTNISGGRSADGGGERVQFTVSPPPMFSPQVYWGVLPSGQVAMSFTSGYTVRVVDLEGKTLRYIQRPLRPRMVNEADRERARKQREENMRTGRGMIRLEVGGGGGRGGAPPRPRDLPPMEFADTMPVVRGLVTTPSGKIWVARSGDDWNGPTRIDVITPEGNYLGTLAPQQLPSAISTGGLAAYIEIDDMDVERVVVRRIPAAWR